MRPDLTRPSKIGGLDVETSKYILPIAHDFNSCPTCVLTHVDVINGQHMIYYIHIILLQQACIDDDLDMVEFLVEQGADINRGDNEGWTPLHATASCGFISIAKLV